MATLKLVKVKDAWHIRYIHAGKQVWSKSAGTKNPKEAEAIRSSWVSELNMRQIEAKLKSIEFDESRWRPTAAISDGKKSGGAVSVKEAARITMRELERLHASNLGTANNEKARARAILAGLSSGWTDEVDFPQARKTLEYLQDLGRSPKTIMECLRVARWMLDFWVSMGWSKTNAFRDKGIKGPKVKNPPKAFWTLEEIESIIDSSPAHYKCFWAVQAYAGLRLAEAMALEWRDVVLEDPSAIIVREGKGGKTARVPIGPKLKAMLVDQANRVGRDGKAFPDIPNQAQNINPMLKRICDGMEFEQGGSAHCHRFRHSFASNLVISGIDITRVKELMRHANIKDTMVYAHLRASDLDEAVGIF